MNIRSISIAICFFGTALLSGCRLPAAIRTSENSLPLVERKVSVGGLELSSLLFIPEKIHNTPAVPVVLVFHGGGGKPENMPDVTRFDTLADAEGFVVAYPRGVSRGESIERDTWNAGLCCGYAKKNNIDDVGFIRALLDDLSSVVSIDPRRIFAAGLSNGAL